MRASKTVRCIGLVVVLVGFAACGGNGNGNGNGGASSSATDPNAPVLTNLRATFGSRCTLPGNAPGTTEVLAFEYADADGNVRGGTLENTTSGVAGGSITFSPGIPSPGVQISGTTAGTITFAACLRFGSTAAVTEQVKVIDASGKASNVLIIEVRHPGGGVPLHRRDADPDFRKSR
ncbi:MAG TPA: hypothetical protein VIB60_08630 [Methylomirabilota bacterium]